jgi:hypothetical protein
LAVDAAVCTLVSILATPVVRLAAFSGIDLDLRAVGLSVGHRR